ncbi:daf-12-interacting protein 1 [Cocos nucifera]|uniref:Daf-12-interacting protein 1 n=1 Tax=Cocos nucifera TaxID=13894 RepID=A0A8K0ILE1_COCNU|nr:daf-12-interacting protein 1 [Cocos nucifera]
MDFHSLSRRDLQTLCKKNRIPANMTNVAMADALQALQTVEGIEEIKEASQFQSPGKVEVRSPNLPRTSRRTSARRAPIPDEPKEQHGSPLPRARRVAIKASEIIKLVSEGEEEKKQGPEDAPKSPDACTGQKPQAAPSTRRRVGKKDEKAPQEEVQKQEDGPKEIPKTPASARNTRSKASKETEGHEDPLEVSITPATRYSRRASARRGAQAPMAGEEKQEETVGLRTTRRTRKSTRKPMEETAVDVAANVGRRTTRAKATVKMVALAQEEEEDKKGETFLVFLSMVDGFYTDITTEDSMDPNNDPLHISDVKYDEILMEEGMKPEVQNGAISDSRDSGVKRDGNDGVQDSSTDRADNETTQETENSTPMGKNLGNEAEGEQISEEVPEEEGGNQKDQVLSEPEELPIRGLETSEPTPETNQEQEEPLNGTPEENPMVPDGGSEEEHEGGEDLHVALPDPSLSDEIPANVEDSSRQLLETKAAGDSPLIEENLAVELHSEIEATSDQIPDDLIQNKEAEEASLDVLPTGNSLEETKVSGDELPMDQAPEIETSTDLQANMENGDAPAEFPYEILAAETDVSCDGVEIPEDDGESDDGTLIGNQTAPEPEGVLKAAASPTLQQSPSSDATGPPAKTLAVGGDQIGDPADSAAGSPAKTSAQVGDLIEDPAGSGMESPDIETSAQLGDLIEESPARTVPELEDLAGDLTDSDLHAGTPVGPDHGVRETDSNETIPEIEGGEKKRVAEERVPADIYTTESGGGDGNKENRLGKNAASGLTMVEVGVRDADVKSKVEKPSLPDYNSLSLRKLKALVREKATTSLNNKKVKVADRSTVVTANAETQVVKPLELQELIDAETAKYAGGRCFILPSGTEDIIRKYAGASTQEAADSLVHSLAQHVDHHLGSGSPHQLA